MVGFPDTLIGSPVSANVAKTHRQIYADKVTPIGFLLQIRYHKVMHLLANVGGSEESQFDDHVGTCFASVRNIFCDFLFK